MKSSHQEIFKQAFAEELRAQVSAGNSLAGYQSRSFDVLEGTVIQSMLEITVPPPVLNPDPGSDCENAIKIYEYLGNLDKTQASDKRLWIYLSHVTFRDYTIDRWPLRASIEDLTGDSAVAEKAKNFILDRWFLSGNARSLRRHSIARLWWAAYLTVAPWDRDPEFFSSIDTTDEYLYTKILFSTRLPLNAGYKTLVVKNLMVACPQL